MKIDTCRWVPSDAEKKCGSQAIENEELYDGKRNKVISPEEAAS